MIAQGNQIQKVTTQMCLFKPTQNAKSPKMNELLSKEYLNTSLFV